MNVARQFESLWSKFGAQDAQDLVDQAAQYFDVEFAAISFFDERREIFKAQYGIQSDGVFGRPYSITAHALYTMDVFVVTDTKQVRCCELAWFINADIYNRTGASGRTLGSSNGLEHDLLPSPQ